MAKSRRSFTREFKVQAVRQVTEQHDSFAEAARQLGITENLLRLWKKRLAAGEGGAFPGNGNRSPLEAERERLRAENQRLQIEREILKKAAAFFARESS
jgi:transposase